MKLIAKMLNWYSFGHKSRKRRPKQLGTLNIVAVGFSELHKNAYTANSIYVCTELLTSAHAVTTHNSRELNVASYECMELIASVKNTKNRSMQDMSRRPISTDKYQMGVVCVFVLLASLITRRESN